MHCHCSSFSVSAVRNLGYESLRSDKSETGSSIKLNMSDVKVVDVGYTCLFMPALSSSAKNCGPLVRDRAALMLSFLGKVLPLYSVILVGLPVRAPSLTSHWDGHVIKTSNFPIFSGSIHSAWLNWREKGALPLSSWTRKSMSWDLMLLP